ncbi:MAG: DUF4197 domain-containing protein [Lewinella sp.]|nr:DUF4197 domain-containing protein [Lewinella sp.]
MWQKLSFILIVFSLSACTTTDLNRVLGSILDSPLTEGEVASGLKEALEKGISKGAEALAAVDGYYKSPYKILLPEEARKVTTRLQNVPGFSELEETILEKINRGAEDAATRAKPIFVDAIRSMSIADAFNILRGEQDAATQYLERTTYDALYAEFNPVIVTSLDKFNARQYWADAVNAYNSIPFLNDEVDPDLDDYVTRQALNGLFAEIAKEELNIRENVGARTTDLLRKVFAAQDE